jgi:hypothetical protein
MSSRLEQPLNKPSQVYQRQLSKQGLQSIVVDEKEQANALSRCVCDPAGGCIVDDWPNFGPSIFTLLFTVLCFIFHVVISEDLHDVFTLREDTDCDTYDMIRCSQCQCCSC